MHAVNHRYHYNSGAKSYSQRKRDKLDYRQEYFNHNPGLFGSIYFCAYCRRPLFRDEVEVDHIMPLNNALGRNVRWNLVAACRRCNRAKSDTVDGRVVLGYTSKVADTAFYTVQKTFIRFIYLLLSILMVLIKIPLIILRAVFTKSSFMTKIVFIVTLLIIFVTCGVFK